MLAMKCALMYMEQFDPKLNSELLSSVDQTANDITPVKKRKNITGTDIRQYKDTFSGADAAEKARGRMKNHHKALAGMNENLGEKSFQHDEQRGCS